MKATETNTIRVLMGGAICQGGFHTLASPATLKDALTSAGGLSGVKGAPAAGIVSIRRPGGWPHPPTPQERFRFDIFGADSSWEQFMLADRDSVVFQFSVGGTPREPTEDIP